MIDILNNNKNLIKEKIKNIHEEEINKINKIKTNIDLAINIELDEVLIYIKKLKENKFSQEEFLFNIFNFQNKIEKILDESNKVIDYESSKYFYHSQTKLNEANDIKLFIETLIQKFPSLKGDKISLFNNTNEEDFVNYIKQSNENSTYNNSINNRITLTDKNLNNFDMDNFLNDTNYITKSSKI